MTNLVPEIPDLSQAERIDQVCTDFEEAWKTGVVPRLEDWLRDVSVADRLALLHELLPVEVHYRGRCGETVSAAEYRRRFPELEDPWLQRVIPSCQETAAHNGIATPDPVAPIAGPFSEMIRCASAYELGDEIGRGGMGVVYCGHDTGLNRTLAVKVLLEKHAGNDELKRRFLEEAQIMGQLQHPGVAPIHEIGRLADGRPFFSMKQIKGQTLTELLREGQVPPRGGRKPAVEANTTDQRTDVSRAPADLPRFLAIFAQICQTVAFAHSRGILHRDLKPGNVMVGAFGEVQVMDWGLAKVLTTANGVRQPTDAAAQTASTIFTPRTGASDGAETAAGRVLGTPAYMAPEQARGDVEQLDERSDVFGLGALLCELLTGQPPFPGDTQMDSHRKAMKCDLQETFTRLAGCGADPELVELARRCLAGDKADRPRDAGVVAEAVAQYQAGVLERLQRAEIDRARAQVKVAEERRRRRVQLTLAGVVVAFVVAAAGVGVWYYHDQAERNLTEVQEEAKKTARKQQLKLDLEPMLVEVDEQRRDLHKKLGRAQTASVLLSDIQGWRTLVAKIRESWNRARFLALSDKELLENSWFVRLDTLDQEIKANEKDWHWAKKLDDINLRAATLMDGKWEPQIAAKKYPALFRELGLDVAKGDVIQLAEQIKKSPIRYALVAALDHWAKWPDPTKGDSKARLLALARQADPDPWRDQIRDEKVLWDQAKLLWLAKEAKPSEQTSQIILLLAWNLQYQNGRKEGVALLHKALLHYPKDFWLHFELGNMVENPAEKVGCWRAALTLRPDSAPAHLNLGNALNVQKDLDGAIRHFEKAIELDKNFALPHLNLGNTLRIRMDLEGAIKHYQRAIELDPSLAFAHNGLGNVLEDKKDLDGAIKHYQKAIALKCAFAHNSLANVLIAKKDLDGAIKHFHKAIALDQNLSIAHVGLGHALRDKKDLDGAIKHFHKAIALVPNYAFAHIGLGHTLRDKKDLDGAIKHYLKAIELNPNYPDAHYILGNALRDRKDLDGAIKNFHKAIELNPKSAKAHGNLGVALIASKDLDGAIKHFRLAIELDPHYAIPHNNLGLALGHKNDREGAIRHFEKAIELDRNFTLAHYNLANALYAKKDLDGARKHFSKAIELDPKYAFAHFNLGNTLYAKKDLDGAIKHFRIATELIPNDPEAHYSLANTLYAKKDLDGAITYYHKGIALDPNDARAHNNLGRTLYDNNDVDRALKHFHKAIALDPKLAQPHLNLGNALRGRKDLDGAIKHYQQAIALKPNYADAQYGLGLALQAKKDLDGALKHRQKAIALDLKSAEAQNTIGIALFEKKDLDGAIKHFEKAIELDPKLAVAHHNLGLALYNKKNLDGAIKHWHLAIELNPNYSQAHYQLGNALDNRNDQDGAIKHYHQAITLNPKYAEAHCNLAYVLRQQGKFAEALKFVQKGHELGTKQPGWSYPSAQWVKKCERLLELDQKLPAILSGSAQPENAAEQVELANLCLVYKKHHVAAARFFVAALKAEPRLADKYRSTAACAAVLAAAGQGNDADKLEKNEPAQLRQQALDWLQAELADVKRQLQANPNTTGILKARLQHWQKDPELAAVREAKELAKLPEAERRQWQLLWVEVDELLKLGEKVKSSRRGVDD